MEGQPVTENCDACNADSSRFKNIGFGETVYCLNCIADRIEDVPVDYIEELLFEGDIEGTVYEDEVVEVTSETEFGICTHEFPITVHKKEKFSKGNPNSSQPGHGGFYYQNELDADKATVTILEPTKQELDYKSDYFLSFVKELLEK